MELLEQLGHRTHLAKLVSKKEVAEDTFEFIFELELEMQYEPGQYVWVEVIHMQMPDPKGNRRAFSITSIPDNTKRISILFRATKSGFNQSLRALDVGDELNILGSFGDAFCFPDDPDTPLVLIAGGAGVAPFLSLVRYAAQTKSTRPISLIVANKTMSRASYVDELEKYSNDNTSIKVTSITGEISAKDIKQFSGLDHAMIYVCGPQGFVDYVYAAFKKEAVFEHQFHFEYYYPTTTIDKELTQLFANGRPDIKKTETPHAYKRAMLMYELTNSTATHTVITDISGRIIFANQAAQQITGYTLEEMLGNTPRLWGGLMSKQFYKKLWATKLRGEVFNGEIINRRKNNETYIAAAHISPIKNENGEVVGFIGSEEDITAVRKSEQKAIENEERFVELTEKIPEVYWIIEVHPVEKVVYVNPAFEKIWGSSRSALYENPRLWIEKIHPADKAKISEAFDKFLKGKSEFDAEFRIILPEDRSVIIHLQGEQVLDKEGNVLRVVGVAHDITKEKTIDQEKSEFVSFASHQLKTPITAIRWNIESLLAGRYGELSLKQKEIMDGIYSMNMRIDELISNLLNISRIEQGVFLIEPKPTDFVKICEEVLLEAGPYIEKKGHVLTKNFEPGLPIVSADQKLLRIIFQNFISNAIKYTPANGSINVSLNVRDNEIVFSVANSGEPIPEGEQSKIFGKMFRASNAVEQDSSGTGLGLYIVKEILENCGGRVWFTSKAGEDTVFYASIPLTGMIRKAGTKPLA